MPSNVLTDRDDTLHFLAETFETLYPSSVKLTPYKLTRYRPSLLGMAPKGPKRKAAALADAVAAVAAAANATGSVAHVPAQNGAPEENAQRTQPGLEAAVTTNDAKPSPATQGGGESGTGTSVQQADAKSAPDQQSETKEAGPHTAVATQVAHAPPEMQEDDKEPVPKQPTQAAQPPPATQEGGEAGNGTEVLKAAGEPTLNMQEGDKEPVPRQPTLAAPPPPATQEGGESGDGTEVLKAAGKPTLNMQEDNKEPKPGSSESKGAGNPPVSEAVASDAMEKASGKL